MSSHQQKARSAYGSLREKTIDYGDDDAPPAYVETTRSQSNWSHSRIAVLVGFSIIQLVLFISISRQIYSNDITPEQIHLSLGKNDNEYYVSWATPQRADCQVTWSKNGSTVTKSIQGIRKEILYEDGPEDQKTLYKEIFTFSERTFKKYFYFAKMTVSPSGMYTYFVSCKQTTNGGERDDSHKGVKETVYLSDRYHFKAVPFDDSSRPTSLIFYGDLGLRNAQSVPRLIEEAKMYQTDLIIHNGDFAYDLDTERGQFGDQFMKLMEPIAARLPYQTSVGNHEIARNFSYYDKRFKMIDRGPINNGRTNNFFYSFNAGPIHFIAISTEFYYFLDYVGIAPLVSQYEWLKSDLAAANSPSERAKRPWIIVFGHRPMYCSSRDHDDCSKRSNLLRNGLPFTGAYALEKLFYESGVDIELYSHEHQYERFLPIYNGTVYNGTDKADDPYFNPFGPVHLISGSAGCEEKLDPFTGHPVTGSVKQIADYGYTKIFASHCKIHLHQVSDDKSGTYVDEFTVSKNKQNFPPDQKGKIVYEVC